MDEIFCDVDGVLADFNDAAKNLLGWPNFEVRRWHWYEDLGLNSTEFWNRLKAHDDFYSLVKPYPWTMPLVSQLSKYGKLTLVTASPVHGGLISSKIRWVSRELGGYMGKLEVILCDRKELLAKPGRVLIDDKLKNIERFKQVPGAQTIKFPQPWNCDALTYRERSVVERVQYVTHRLDTLVKR